MLPVDSANLLLGLRDVRLEGGERGGAEVRRKIALYSPEPWNGPASTVLTP